MCRAILMVLLAVTCSSAMAEWVKIGSNAQETLYVDPDTFLKHDEIVKIWILYNFDTPQEKNGLRWQSVKMQYENNCTQIQQRSLSTSAHSEQMGNGNTVFYNPAAQQWVPVSP